ncbi:MAG TPA: YcnI family protein [Sporichthyaceae bacterium]
MMRSTMGSGLVVALALVVVGAPLASAHVTVSSDSTTKGSGASLTFRVPNERDEASTTAVEVDFPTDHPLTGVSVLSKPGWTFSATEATAASTASPAATTSASPSATPTPSATAMSSAMPGMNMGGMSGMGGMHGNVFLRAPATDDDDTAAVTAITWHIDSAVSAIPPGGYDLFTVQVPKLPTDTDTLTFKAVQTYSSGEVVRWIEVAAPGTAEPEHPAPTLQLTDAAMTMPPTAMPTPAGGMTMTSTPMAGGMSMDMGPSRDDTVNVALGLGIAGLFLGLVAGTLGGAALARSRGTKSGD